jgi:hypothetical protein
MSKSLAAAVAFGLTLCFFHPVEAQQTTKLER